MNLRINFKSLAYHLLVPIMLLFIILMLIPGWIDYQNNLRQSVVSIPSIIFFSLYLLMYLFLGIAAYLVDITEGAKGKAFNYYYTALLLNLLYIPIIFGTRNLFVGFLWSIFLLVFVFLTYKEFRKINKTSGTIFIFLFGFTVYITYYSFMLFILNN